LHRINLSEIKNGFVLKEGKNVNLYKNSFGCSFLLCSWRSDRDGAFLLSEVDLVRFGSDVAYLDISWARVVDLNPKAEIGPTTL
jgi:hypothetical protein